MIRRILKRFTSLVLVFVMVVAFMPATASKAYAEDKPLTWSDKHIELLHNDGEWTVEEGKITGTIEGDKGCESYNTATLTIKNNTTVEAEVSFDYIVEEGNNGGCAEINGEKVSDGKYTAHLNSGESINIKIRSGNATKTDGVPTTIKIENLTAVNNDSVKVVFEAAESGNYSVNGESIKAATEYETKVWSIYELEAIPDENEVFLGWYDEDGNCISKEKNYLLEVERNITVSAGFMEKDKGCVYNVCGEAFCTLKDAIAYAEEENYSFITLLADAVLSEDCTIPKGITLLIPFDNEDTLYKEQPEAVSAGAIATSKSEFRRLTLSEGAKLIVNGEISVGGQYRSVAGSSPGYMSGNYGQIMLEQNSKITVSDGGALYAWGFISGEGSVVAEAGSAVHEWYQIMDFRGGTATIGMGNKVFPFSQYSVQNIESTLTLKQGANEFVYAAVFASSRINYSSINFIGDNGLFKVVDGSFSKEYDGAADRMNYTIDGTVELNNLNLSLGGMSVSSKAYVLPVTNNTTINVKSGSKLTVNQDTALLAGTMTNIAENSELVINDKVYVYDRDEWMANKYACTRNFYSIEYAPSKTYTHGDADITDAEINNNGLIAVNGALYTTEGGADICSSNGTGIYKQGSEPGTETVTYQYTQSGTSVKAHEIPITPAKLQDSSYCIETAAAKAGDEIKWGHVANDWNDGEITKAATCTETGIKKLTCKNCGVTGTEIVAATGHNLTKTGAKNAICEEAGNSEYYTCSVCNKYFSYDNGKTAIEKDSWIIAATGHNWGNWAEGDAENHERICLNNNNHIEKAAHSYGNAVYTWTDDGKSCTAEKECTVCSRKVTEEATVSNGKVTSEVTKTATCTAKGTTTYTATFEEESFADQTKDVADIKATGHDMKKHEAKDVSCTEDGHNEYYTCNNCNKVFKDETGEKETTVEAETIVATGHKMAEKKAKDATCEAAGNSAYYTCSVCNKYFSDDKGQTEIKKDSWVIPAQGHDEVRHEAKKATCADIGWEEYDTCTRCGYTTYKEIPATGHTEVVDETKEATCTETGLTEGKHCSECGAVLVAQDEIPVKDHDWDVGVVTKAPACEVAGEMTYNCKNCNAAKTEAIAALKHEWKTEWSRDEAGHWHDCSHENCKAKDSYAEHDWNEGEITKAATCTAAGVRTFTCSVCNATKTEAIAKVAHKAVVVEATAAKCTVNGNKAYYTCSECGKYFTDADCTKEIDDLETWKKADGKIEATGHTEEIIKGAAATCTEAGLTDGKKCSVCNEVLIPQDTVEALGHSWNESYTVDKPAACIEKGSESIHCSRCEASKDAREIQATGHSYKDWKCIYCGASQPSGGTVVKDNITSNDKDKKTTADLTPAVKGNRAETTVDAKTAEKIVEKALANKSEEIIVDAVGNKTAASSEVDIPEKTVKEIAEKTDARLVIKTDSGEVTLDKEAVKALADQASTTGTVKLVVETVKTDADICKINLELVTSDRTVTNFRGGSAAVTVKLNDKLAAKEVKCVYIDDRGKYHKVEGSKGADGTFTFKTGHFSTYAIMAADEADKVIAEQDEQLNTLIKEVSLKVKTARTSKKNIRVTVSGDVKALTDAGYTVKYRFFRSAKKASGYTAKTEVKNAGRYINTAGKKGTKYYYKVKAYVYDGDTLAGKTTLTQCKYGCRTWSK